MICFLDQSFCSASDECATVSCSRNFGPEMQIRARQWWGKEGAPVSFFDFRVGCEEYLARLPNNNGEGDE